MSHEHFFVVVGRKQKGLLKWSISESGPQGAEAGKPVWDSENEQWLSAGASVQISATDDELWQDLTKKLRVDEVECDDCFAIITPALGRLLNDRIVCSLCTNKIEAELVKPEDTV